MHYCIQKLYACREACDRDAFIIRVHPQNVRFGHGEGEQAVGLDVVQPKLRRVRGPGGNHGHRNRARKCLRNRVLDQLVEVRRQR